MDLIEESDYVFSALWYELDMWHSTCTGTGQADNYNMTCREQFIAHKWIMNDKNVSFHLIQLQWSWSLVSLVPTVPSATIPQLYHNSTNIYISSNDPPESALMKTFRSQNIFIWTSLPSVAIRVTFQWLVQMNVILTDLDHLRLWTKHCWCW